MDCDIELESVILPNKLKQVNAIPGSELLDKLSWTYFHHSVLELANLSFIIRGTSRAVLQEHARHRIQSLTVRSTRYTMGSVINAFVAEIIDNEINTMPTTWFCDTIHELDLFVTTEPSYNQLQITDIWNKLKHQWTTLGSEQFIKLTVAKSSLHLLDMTDAPTGELFQSLESGKQKKNVADNFKHIVNDNFKVDMVIHFNLRSLKNYFDLRASGAAWFQIQWLAEAMIKATPRKYLDLILKEDKIDKILGETD